MAKAYEFLEDARANFKEGRYKTSINRSYYAVLNTARSLLILKGTNLQTHEGILTMLGLRFIKPGILSIDVFKKFKMLFSRRTNVDYRDFETIDKADAEDSIKTAENIIKLMDKLRKKIII
ncbi:MAG: HEPN domain-containing protein [Nitrospirae bacterium]|nr:HEPN domain-containing protein [Nitrospirota bacterium]